MLLTCSLFLAAFGGLFAQTGDNVRSYFIPARSFNIPFSLADNDPRIEVLLHVSTDGREYRSVASARPSDRKFPFLAPADGWYSFIVQTRDAGGVVTPANLRGATPSIRICVDTQAPVIEELAAGESSPSALPSIRWKIAEPNLKEIWADYRAAGGEWMPLFVPVQEQGTHPWKPMWTGELEVRMQALDKAGNRSQVRTLRLRAADNVSRMPPPQEPSGAGKVMFVKSKTFQLNYTLDDQTIGPSRVASVDIWKLHRGQGWRKCSEKGTSQGTATVSVDAAGRWGFRLIPRSGAGLAERDPQQGDAPDIWVEVDDKPPQVQVNNVTVTQEGDEGYLTVYWRADDAFLRSMPITIYQAAPEGKDKEWVPIAKDLPNTGSWRQKVEALNLGTRYQLALKVEAVDEAGNIGSAQWRDTVKVDLKVPRIKHIEVKPGGATGGGQETYGFPPRVTPNGVRPLESQPAGRQPASPTNGSNQRFDQVIKP